MINVSIRRRMIRFPLSALLLSRARPSNYLDDLRPCAEEITAEGWLFDRDAPCYKSLEDKYRQYVPTAEDQWRFELARAEHAAKIAERIAASGRRAWGLLHTEGIGKGPEWLARWEQLIPCGECRRKYEGLKSERPPSFPLSAEWTWQLHDAVSATLPGKPRPSFAEAGARWKWLR